MTRDRFLKLLVVLIALALILVLISKPLIPADGAPKNERVKDKIQFGPVELPHPGTSPQVPPAYPKSVKNLEPEIYPACKPSKI